MLTLVIALWSKNIMLALFLGIVSCSIYTGGLHFLMLVFDKYIYNGISSNVDIFIYMIVFGAFMVAVKRGGGFAAFSSFGDKHFDTPRKAKLITWLLSGIVINQGFGTIGVGAIMRPITDKQKVSREKLGYILSSTAEPVVALVPITIYILVFGGLISSVLPELDGQQVFVESIPYNFFCILSVLVGLLTAAELLPDFGFMKKREKAAKRKRRASSVRAPARWKRRSLMIRKVPSSPIFSALFFRSSCSSSRSSSFASRPACSAS